MYNVDNVDNVNNADNVDNVDNSHHNTYRQTTFLSSVTVIVTVIAPDIFFYVPIFQFVSP